MPDADQPSFRIPNAENLLWIEGGNWLGSLRSSATCADRGDAGSKAIRAMVEDLGFPVDVAVVLFGMPMETDPRLPFVQMARDVASRVSGQAKSASAMPGITDASLCQPALGIPVIVCGPGEFGVAHQPDEWVAVQKYLGAIRFYIELARAYLT